MLYFEFSLSLSHTHTFTFSVAFEFLLNVLSFIICTSSLIFPIHFCSLLKIINCQPSSHTTFGSVVPPCSRFIFFPLRSSLYRAVQFSSLMFSRKQWTIFGRWSHASKCKRDKANITMAKKKSERMCDHLTIALMYFYFIILYYAHSDTHTHTHSYYLFSKFLRGGFVLLFIFQLKLESVHDLLCNVKPPLNKKAWVCVERQRQRESERELWVLRGSVHAWRGGGLNRE